MPPTQFLESYWPSPNQALSAEQIRDAYNRYVEGSLQRAGYILASLYALFTVLHYFVLDPAPAQYMVPLAAAGGVVIFGVTWFLRNYEVNPSWVHGIAAVIMEVVLINSLAHLALTRQAHQTDNLMLAAVGAGFFFLATRWYVSQLVLIHIGWWLVRQQVAQPVAFGADDLWQHYQVGLFSATFLSLMVHLSLRHLVIRVAALRVRDDMQKQALQSALNSVQQNELSLRKYSQQTEESLQQTEALYRVSQSISSAATLDDVLQRAVDSMAEVLPAHLVTINLLDVTKRQLQKVVQNSSVAPLTALADFDELMNGLTGWALHRSKPALSIKGVFDPREPEESYQRRKHLGIGSVLVAPIIYRDKPLGSLSAANRFDQRDFSERDAETLMTMGSQLGAAIANVYLLDELRHQATELDRLIEAAAAPILSIDRNGAIRHWSAALQRLTRVTTEQATGCNFIADFVASDARIEVQRVLDGALRGQNTDGFECPILDGDGVVHVLLLSCTMTLDADGEITGALAIGQDITRRRLAEEEMQRSNEELEQRVNARTNELTLANQQLQRELAERQRIEHELRSSEEQLARRIDERTAELSTANAELNRAARLKDEFLANMSHELRTPLSAVLGLSEALQEQVYGPLNEKQAKTVNSVVESSRLLLSLINDILDISKIEAGKFQLEYDWMTVASVARASIDLVRQNARKKGIEVELQVDPAITTIYADERRLKQILANLLSNAVKFTPDQGRVGLDVVGDSAKQAIRLTVWDTGIGISTEDIARLFQPFVQLDSSLARQHPGTGLGLALVYRMTRMHGGSITVESEPGSGSRFTVSLPWEQEAYLGQRSSEFALPTVSATRSLERPDRMNGAHAYNNRFKPSLVLVADDNEATLDAFTDYLVSHGYQIVSARSGAEAVAVALELQPAAILMDINMPQMDGLEAIRKIRANQGTAQTPIIAITAMAMPGDRERCLVAGASDYLSKPVSLHTVLETIAQQLKLEQPPSNPATEAQA